MAFITLSGIEGSGKSTQMRHISEFLTQIGKAYVLTREPGGTEIGQKIRSILLDPENKSLVPKAELLLYAADRSQHIETVIRPALKEGKVVVCDRFKDCTTVFQGYARNLDLKLINKIHDIVLDDLAPDITFLLDLPVETGLARAWEQLDGGSRNGNESRFEQEALAFHEKVRAGYLDLAQMEPERFHIIDASKNEKDVGDEIIAVLKDFFDV